MKTKRRFQTGALEHGLLRSVLLILTVFCLSACIEALAVGKPAEPPGADGLRALLDPLGFETLPGWLETLESGEPLLSEDVLEAMLKKLKERIVKDLGSLLKAIAPFIAVSAAVNTLTSEDSRAARCAALVCRCGVAELLISRLKFALDTMTALLEALGRVAEKAMPIWLGALGLTGNSIVSTALTPLSGLCAWVMENAFQKGGAWLCGCAAIVAVAGGVTDQFRLDRLFGLLRGAGRWIIGLSLTLFTALLSVEGLRCLTWNGVMLKAARSAAEGIVPIIGKEISESMGALLQGTRYAKNAMGLTGVMLVGWYCVKPIAAIALTMASVRLTSAMIEPVAESGVTSMAGRCGDILEMMLTLCIGGLALLVLLLGACLAATGMGRV